MNRKIKEGLKEIYSAPAPLEKETFLAGLGMETGEEQNGILSYKDFLLSQFRYMQKHNFAVSLGLFVFTLLFFAGTDVDVIWILSAFAPFLALSAAMEGKRSVRYGMEELEMASRFSMKSVLMARLILLETGNLFLLGVVLPVILMAGKEKMLYTGFYILVPYLLTAFLSLYTLRKVRGSEGGWLCFAAAGMVSLGFIILRNMCVRFYEMSYYGKWAAAVAVFLALTVRECGQLLKEAEECSWSL
ncbi:MAG: hypothetical protein NC086_05190 [Alistipes sp.]|nr:hypothetical protein [Alistipes sp.]